MTAESTARRKISFKLLVLMTLLILFTVTPLIYVVFTTVVYFGNYAVSVNRAQIKEQAYAYLRTIARERAEKYETLLSRAAVASSMMAAQAKDIYDNKSYYRRLADGELLLTRNEKNGMYATSSAQQVPAFYWGGEQITEEVAEELQILTHLDNVMIMAKQKLTESHAAHIITVSGIGRYLCYDRKSVEALYDLPPAAEFDLRDGEPVTVFSREGVMKPETRWTRVYKDDVISGLMMTATSSVIDGSGRFRGITGIDIPLDNIVRELLQGSGAGDGSVLFSFLLDKSGRLIAFPREYLELFGIEIDWGKFRNSSDILEYNIAESTREEIAAILPRLLGADSDMIELELDSVKYLLTMQAMDGFGWSLVLVNRETDLVSSVARTEEALTGTMHLLWQKILVNVLFILLFVVVTVFLAVRHFVLPLQKLSVAALRVGEGDLATRCHINRNDELGILADSFNDMVRRLETAERIQKRHAGQLESAVAEQTRDLQRKNIELEQIIAELNIESKRRKSAVKALEQSEKQLRITMDASLAGLCILQENGFKYANPQLAKIFGYEVAELTGDFDPMNLIAPDNRGPARESWAGWLAGDRSVPYVLPCVRKDGTTFDALVGGDLIVWQGKKAVVATLVDVSAQRKIEEELRESQRMLRESLAEKEVLMREIYHRAKNNMLVIISMLDLQALDIEDGQVREMFKETENRIRAMSLAHEKLYQSQSLSEVDLAAYLRDLATSLVETMVLGKRIGVVVEGDDQVVVCLDDIVPLGLAVNEIVTNSIKHAFVGMEEGTIGICLRRGKRGEVEVRIGDDGVGMPDDIDPHRVHSLGLQITVNLIERQLNGSLEVSREGGTTFLISFNEMTRPKRV